MISKAEYKVGDKVIISHDLNTKGMWIKIPPTIAKIVEIKEITPTYGIPYVLEVSGRRLTFCFWECDIDKKAELDEDESWYWEHYER